MENEEKLELINKVMKEIRSHREPAPATLKHMEEVDKKLNGFTIMINNIQNDIKNINKALEDNNCQHKEILVALEGLNDKLDTKYASKKVEGVLWAFGSAIGLAVLYAILDLVLKR